MTEDFIDKEFAGLAKYYPGSKRVRKMSAPPAKVEPLTWNERPTIKTLPNGKDVEMYTIGALATALGRPIITIRTWIKLGYLPESPYRLPTKLDKRGKEVQGRRLYTRPMIEAAVSLFESAGVSQINRIDWSLHRNLVDKIDEAWEKIRVQETEITEIKE